MGLGLCVLLIGILSVLYYLSIPVREQFQDTAPFKVFNLDLHQSVIEDIKNIFATLYGGKVEITNWSISNHNHYFGKPTAQVKVITQDSWKNIDTNMIEQFQEEYDSVLSEYDAFVVTHTPVFAMLYEKYGKPIIVVNTCRYDQPFCWNNNASMLKLFHMALKRMNDSGQLIAISNNLADQKYLKDGAGIDSTHIPSLCQYTNAHYSNPTRADVMIFSTDVTPHIKSVPNSEALIKRPENYKFTDLIEYKAIVHMPYEVSTMSIFEQYFAGIPLFFPTKEFYKKCISEGKANLIFLYNSWGRPLTNTEMDTWLDKSDYYTFKYINYYSSFEDCVAQINSYTDANKEERLSHIEQVKEKVLNDWRSVLGKILP